MHTQAREVVGASESEGGFALRVGMLEVSGSPVMLHLLMRQVLAQSAEVCEAAAAVRVAAAPADKQQ